MLPGNGVNVTAMFNNQAYHTPSLTLSMVSNAILQLLTSGGHSMELTNHPLPRCIVHAHRSGGGGGGGGGVSLDPSDEGFTS